ncbi:MAG: amino acid carrier protein, partial [Clostridia bacterium]|nr:amino acid carrier protein [Clostridia bacterium]
MKWLEAINSAINDFVWGVPMIATIIIVGLFLTFVLKGVQFIHPIMNLKQTIGEQFSKIRKHKEKDKIKEKKQRLSSFQAAMTSVAAIIGSGNIAGVATAVVMGGPGALFWMIIAAVIGMATKFAEIALGVKFRKQMKDGSFEGGPMYYLRDGIKIKWLKWIGYAYAILVIPTAFIISAVVDTNTISDAVKTQFNINPIITGCILAIVVALIIFGGTKRVGKICGWLTPIMGVVYLLAGLLIIFLNIKLVPTAFEQIFKGAFNPSSITGGAIGSFLISMRYGVARGIFSNEAGLGTSAMIHGGADVEHPIKQAFWGPVEVFLDTIFACTVTALAIIISGLWSTGEYEGASLTLKAFEALLPGGIGNII